jgi:hypothetical protein
MTRGQFEYDDHQGNIRNERGDIVGHTDDGLGTLDENGAAAPPKGWYLRRASKRAPEPHG